ncbi:MAG TPA: acyltransferase [Propionibacteriaceae bacterium]|nr:acyltransferase [Propionibacteriaceae bacterium]
MVAEPEPFAGPFPPNKYHPLAWILGDPLIGDGTWIGPFCLMDGSGGLTIGSGCDFAAGTHVYTHSSALRCVSGRRHPAVDRAPVVIGDRVFVGANCVIQMGVTIGDESIISAGSVVTRDVPPRTVVAGVPARVVGTVDLTDPENPAVVRV